MLSSLKILDFSTLLPGPFASMMLADLGADVLRVEAPHRPDMVRLLPPFDGETSGWHGVLNRNKRSIALDLKKPEAITIIKKLIATYDVVLEQFRPGVMDRLGLGYETLKQVNPRLIYCSLTGYGQTGPMKDRAGHDNNYLALSGMMSYSGRRENGPPPLGMQVADIGGGALGAMVGLLTAVIHRQQTDQGQLVDISMFDMMVAWQSHMASHYLIGDEVPDRETMPLNGGGFYDYYATSDGRYLSVGSLEPKFWQGFCEAIDRPDLVQQVYQSDLDKRRAVKTEVQAIIASKPLAEWQAIFAELDVCVEPVLTLPAALAQPQIQARQMVVAVPKADGTTQQQIGSPIKLSRHKPQYRFVGVPLGQHTDEVLTEIGYSEVEMTALHDARVCGPGSQETKR